MRKKNRHNYIICESYTYMMKCIRFIICLLLFGTTLRTSAAALMQENLLDTTTSDMSSSSSIPPFINHPMKQRTALEKYDFKCFHLDKENADTLNVPQKSIRLQVTEDPLHQIMTRIFSIFLHEVLEYQSVSLVPVVTTENDIQNSFFETNKLQDVLESLLIDSYTYDVTMMNIGIRMPSEGHNLVPKFVYDVGTSMPCGRFGWFVPIYQTNTTTLYNNIENKYKPYIDDLHYSVFLNPSNEHYQQYILDDEVLEELLQGVGVELKMGPLCENQQRRCVTLLAEHKVDTVFVMHEINETNSYLNILWLGQSFREKLHWLHTIYQNDSRYLQKKFIVLHWTPSDIIDGEYEYKSIVMRRCEDSHSLMNTFCKYELTPILKYFFKSAASDTRLLHGLRMFFLTDMQVKDLQLHLIHQQQTYLHKNNDWQLIKNNIYNKIACNWMQQNEETYNTWIEEQTTIEIRIGGIFPITETHRGHQNLVAAVKRAVVAINKNKNILKKYNLIVPINDGQCKPDVVLKAFIHYFSRPQVLGVLGPACSETVEPIAGISKHTNMTVISYSAEGASFVDRKAYPYFFRTIGSNWQYVDVYIALMQRLNWRRVAALTEDGQKYTEYISHMEAIMKQHDLELIMNKKFLNEVTAAEMNKILKDLKHRRAKIIIADIHNRNAVVALCEAYKLGMTAYQGYVWFLPAWLSKNFSVIENVSYNGSCSSEELEKAFDGHLTIMHTPFGSPNAIMQENKTIKQWLDNYSHDYSSISNYAGFAYDAVWTYALAADKLLSENSVAVDFFRSDKVIKRFVEHIWQTDFEGLSGRVRFGQGGSRITDLDIKQWRKTQFVQVGKFTPKVLGLGSNMHTDGGNLDLQLDAIEWLSTVKPPGDGTYDCSFATLAEILNTDCDSAAVIFTALLCLMAVVVISLISFLFWKQRYDSKLKQSAKIMKTFGIDLLSPSRNKNNNTLDKWEIPKENVVINRRLGEGAFGTVYGGEAQLTAECWTAVAVKTLKAGASNEDRLDFLSEAEAMKRFQHKNIVKLLGVCLQSEPIYTIMEFMLYGDLKTYLLARRHLVNEKTADDSDISPKRLTMYALDVARGLAYLAQQKYVHRDLACRNCLVNTQRVVKLGDFGMARPTFNSDYYRFNRKGMLPVRWMAPESLALGMFTPASDVWAFGVVIYEVITFGSFPYQGLTNNQVLEYVKSGKKLQIPNGVKPQLEGLLNACWSQDVKKRPTATDLVDYISIYPRLLSPCLDFPSASVAMPETESDQLELLPKLRKCSPQKSDTTLDLDIISQANTQTNFERNNQLIQDRSATQPTENLYVNPMNIETFSAVTPDGYSVMSPLLMHQVSESSNSSQTRLLPTTTTERQEQTPF